MASSTSSPRPPLLPNRSAISSARCHHTTIQVVPTTKDGRVKCFRKPALPLYAVLDVSAKGSKGTELDVEAGEGHGPWPVAASASHNGFGSLTWGGAAASGAMPGPAATAGGAAAVAEPQWRSAVLPLASRNLSQLLAAHRFMQQHGTRRTSLSW